MMLIIVYVIFSIVLLKRSHDDVVKGLAALRTQAEGVADRDELHQL